MHWSSTLRLLHWARCNSLKVHLRSSVNVKFADALKRRIEDNIEVWPILLLHPVQHVTSNQRMTTQNHQIQKNMFWIHSVLFSNFHDIIKSWQMWMDDEFFSQGAVLKSLGHIPCASKLPGPSPRQADSSVGQNKLSGSGVTTFPLTPWQLLPRKPQWLVKETCDWQGVVTLWTYHFKILSVLRSSLRKSMISWKQWRR